MDMDPSDGQLDLYQELAGRTDKGHPLAYYLGGLCEEAGEAWGAFKKSEYHGHPPATMKVLEELGDALWMIARAARKLGYDLSDVANRNIFKLQKRYPEGFSSERSINRDEYTHGNRITDGVKE